MDCINLSSSPNNKPRTRICDPAFLNDTRQIDEIPTKEYAALISPNMTDDRTHPPSYYNPTYDTPLDHGTVNILLWNLKSSNEFADPYLRNRRTTDGGFIDIYG